MLCDLDRKPGDTVSKPDIDASPRQMPAAPRELLRDL
jgi:hypothetical protein